MLYTNGQLDSETKFAVIRRTLWRESILPIQRFNVSTIHAARAIVVQSEAKSLLILINRGDMGKFATADHYPITGSGADAAWDAALATE